MLSRGEILAVDDDPDILELLSSALSREGFAVTCAASGEEALARVTAGAFDLVVLDLMMPGMGGAAALRAIRGLAPDTEVIILTAHGSVDSAVECLRGGAFDYLKKPFGLAELAAAVGRGVEKRLFARLAAASFSAESPEGLMDFCAASAARLFAADEALVGVELPGKGFKVSCFYGPGSALALDAGEEVCRRALDLLAGAKTESLAAAGPGALPGVEGVGHLLAAALPDSGNGPGVLCVTRAPGRPQFGEDDLKRARVLGPLAALALRNSELNWQLRSARSGLVRAQKMEALGLMVGQVSHDFNNLLSVIMGSAVLLREDPSPGNAGRISAGILEVSRASAALIKQLLAFSRGGPGQPGPADLNAALGAIRLVMDKLAGKERPVAYELATGLPRVRISAERFKQAALNLVANARDALPRGGAIRVATRLAAPEELSRRGAAGPFVVLEVEDSGAGIAPADLPRVFEAFYTTKPDGKGTGLGLHIVRSVAEENGGWAEAANREGGGAVFRVFLPADPAG